MGATSVLNATSSSVRGQMKVLGLLLITGTAVFVAYRNGFNFPQIVSCGVFVMLIAATVLFWVFHLAFAFLGVSVLLLLNVLDLPGLAQETKLDVIIFLMGMMIIVGVLRDLGLFSWIITRVISIQGMSARKFIFIACAMGAIMSCLVDEMAAVVFVAALVFQVVDALDIKPVPFVIMTVISINIGSAGTMLGNPVGILIGQGARPPLSFNDFMIWSFPIMVVEFFVVFLVMLYLFRADLREMNAKLEERRASGQPLGPIVAVPHALGLLVLFVLLSLMVLHKSIEKMLTLPANTMLITAPLVVSGLLLVWRRRKIRKYLEHDIEWEALIFFMMLFMIAGSLERTGTTDLLAERFAATFGDRQEVLIPAVLGISALGSAFVENIVFVAAFMPIVVKLEQTPLLWALLHGACLGGNVTMVGSTANIVAVGMLERRYWTRLNFFVWLKTGVIAGVISCLVAWAGISLFAPYMPTLEERMQKERAAAPVTAPRAP